MIPIKLTIQGLFSYQEKQTIDFQKLTEAHLFGIFGSVGSGKSSILDAITYALYGETERMNARDNRNYNMMNLKSDELFIEFDFIVGRESTIYRSVVRGKRNRKRFDEVKTLDRTAYKNLDGSWEPFEVEKLQQVIGLGYENFKRTIIIPQGKFQEFLQLGNKDRTQMMKELFNLGKFELYYKTVALETKNSEQMQKLTGQIQQLGAVKPEQLEDALLRLDKINSELLLLKTQLSAKQLEETGLNRLKELTGKLRIGRTNYDLLKTKENDILKLEFLLKEYEYCLINFKNLFDRLEEVSTGIDHLSLTIRNETELLANCVSQLTVLENGFAKIKDDYEHRDLMKQQAGELNKMVRMITLNIENLKLAERIKNGETVSTSSRIKIEENKLLEERLSNGIKTLRIQLPDLAVLSGVQNWFTVQKSLQTIKQDLSKDLELIQNELNNLENSYFTSVKNIIDERPEKQNITVVVEILTDRILEIKKVVDGIDRNIEHLLIREKLEEYATNLEEGKPCPLCGSLSHPEILETRNVSYALMNERDARNKHEKSVQSLEKLITSLREIKTQTDLKGEAAQKLQTKQADNQTKIETHEHHFVWPDYKNEDILIQSFKTAESIQEMIKFQEMQLEKLRIDTDRKQHDLEIYKIELDKIREQQTINHSELITLKNQIEILDSETYSRQTPEQVKQVAEGLMIRYAELEMRYQKTSSDILKIQKIKDESSGKLQANQCMLTQELKTLELIKMQIAEQLSLSEYSGINQIKEILNLKIEIEKERQKIRDFSQELHLAESQVNLITAEIGGRIYDEVLHDKLKLEIFEIGEVQAQKNREMGNTEGEIRKLKIDLEQQKEILSLLEKLSLRADDLKTMKQLFKGSGFVNYVSSVHLRNLCLSANDRFYKLVRQKMSLEITDDNNFQVRDFLNGGKVRSVKTLSGGQTFQAALSLALSLADSIQHFTESSQNFFFLDEGFGSLDKDSLDVVFETLKSLRKENRIVGVISHVEEMQQEIDTHLRIVNDEETGSRIYRSWE